jgi:hypothetical protein
MNPEELLPHREPIGSLRRELPESQSMPSPPGASMLGSAGNRMDRRRRSWTAAVRPISSGSRGQTIPVELIFGVAARSVGNTTFMEPPFVSHDETLYWHELINASP